MTAAATPRDSSVLRLVVIAAVVVMSYVLQATNGHYHPELILWMVGVWVLVLAAMVMRPPERPLFESGVELALLGALVFQLYYSVVSIPPTIEMTGLRSLDDLRPFMRSLIAVGVLAGAGLFAKGRVEKIWFPLCVALHFYAGTVVLALAPTPHIDVWSIEIDSLKALFSGTNPYGITFPNPYGDNSPFFPPGVSVNGRLQFGFVYPPLALLLCAPGWLIGGDPRYSTLAAMGLAALLMGYARPGSTGKLVALIFLFTPRTWFVMDRAWTDPFVVLVTAGVVFTACRYPKRLFIALGLYFCLKQHMWIGAPAALLLFPRPWDWKEIGRTVLRAGAVAAAITLPFVLWGFGAFANSVLDIREVYRTDCLSLLAHWANNGTARLSKWTGIAAMVPVAALGVWRSLRLVPSPGAFALVATAIHFTLYLFSTHAFCNEWYNVIGGLCCAGAVSVPVIAAATAPLPVAETAAPAPAATVHG